MTVLDRNRVIAKDDLDFRVLNQHLCFLPVDEQMNMIIYEYFSF